MKKLFSLSAHILCSLFLSIGTYAQIHAQTMYGNTPPLHVDGKWLKDCHGNTVVLHGVMDTPSPYFNSYRWGYQCNSSTTTACIKYFDKLFTAITDTANGAWCNVFRLHLDPCWTNDDNVTYCEKTGDGEADIQHFSKVKLNTYMRSLYWKIIEKALKHGLYVVMRPPGVCPGEIKVGGVYNNYLMDVWDIVTRNDSIRKYSGQISIELANEPVALLDANGNDTPQAMHDFFQPVVDKIRANGFTGIVWVPGTGWQSNYKNYAAWPVSSYNIGYAVHDYVGWYNTSDDSYDHTTAINSFRNQVPVVETNPIIITEVDWSPYKPGTGHYNEHGEYVESNYGTWATGSTSKWGGAYKATLDHFGNISMTLSGTGCYIDIDKSIATTPAHAVVAFDGNPECCAQACFDWYAEYAKVNVPHPDYVRKWTADQGNGKYKNPILNADFPDPDVIRVGDTYYMSSTTMHHFPGATILKSHDLVNWQYCCNPLEKVDDNDAYNLLNGANHYAQGQWASSLNYSDGKFYLYFICYGRDGVDNTKNIMLTATDPEGKWNMQYWDKHYYDSGWLFDEGENGDGNVYVACGIGDIYIARLRRSDLKELSSTKVLSVGNGLEGCHLYHIGDYYYIYATYGGTEGSQTIFRSKNPLGPYEEHNGRIFANQHIHQGALVETQTGQWWTILFKDAGAIGRIPYLEPVKWVDGWPVIGNNGIDVSKNGAAYSKPVVAADNASFSALDLRRTYLPTNETFTDPVLGMQWEWNHNPDNSSWSVFERPGWMRLYGTSLTDNLYTARNSLTQRIMGYASEGTASSKIPNSYGTVKMDISNMRDGDVAGISVFQDPYSVGAVKMVGGKKYLYSYQSNSDDWTKLLNEKLYAEITSDTIYLRATVNFGTNKATYSYSLDNKTWTSFGVEMTMRYILSIFVGQRFYIFNYSTEGLGGYVDIDWFSTEPVYSEERFYSEGILHAYTEDDLTLDSLIVDKTSYTLLTGTAQTLSITCRAKSGMETDVAPNCKYTVSNPSAATVESGRILSHQDGKTDIIAFYTDHFGNTDSVTFNVKVSTFPLTAGYFDPSIWTTGTFNEKTGALKTGQYGFGGWQYSTGVDISAYRYLVVRLKTSASCSPSFRLFDTNNYWSSPYMYDMGSKKEAVIDLQNMKNQNGAKVDPSHIYIAGFWSYGGSNIFIKEVFLSNDGSTPAALDEIRTVNGYSDQLYDLTGRPASAETKGIILQSNHKYLLK